MSFDCSWPTRVAFGRGRLRELGALAAPLGQRCLLVCGRSAMRTHGFLDAAVASIEDAGLAVEVFDQLSPNTHSDEVDAAAALARSTRAEVVVGMGGGSVLDAAKAVAVSVRLDSVRTVIGATLAADSPALPIVAVPSTAGTGSEISRGAIVLDMERGLKAGVRGAQVAPTVALVDPQLSDTMPADVAMETGFDALTHAIEGYVARRANPLTDALAEAAITMFASAFPAALAGEPSSGAMEAMCVVALLGGMIVASASTCLPHRMQQAMGSVRRIEVAHGRGLAMLYPAWLRNAYPFAASRYDRVAEILGCTSIHDAVQRVLSDCGLALGLRDAGYEEGDLETFLANVIGNVENDPIADVSPAVMRRIYEEAI